MSWADSSKRTYEGCSSVWESVLVASLQVSFGFGFEPLVLVEGLAEIHPKPHHETTDSAPNQQRSWNLGACLWAHTLIMWV